MYTKYAPLYPLAIADRPGSMLLIFVLLLAPVNLSSSVTPFCDKPLVYPLSYGYLSLLPLSADEAADVGVEDGEGLGEQGAHVGDPHQEDRHPEGRVDHRHDASRGGLRGDVAVA